MNSAPLPPRLSGKSFTVQQGRAAGLGVSRLRAKDLIVPSRGIRTPAAGQQPLADLCRPYTQLGPDDVISHGTAAKIHGIPLPARLEADPLLHLSRLGGGGKPRRKHVAGHRLALAAEEIVTLDGVRLTGAARTWLDLAGMFTVEEAVVAGDFIVSAYQRNFGRPRKALVPLAELTDYIGTRPRTHGLALARQALPLLRVGVDSPPETLVRLALQRAGLPEFFVNYPICDRWGDPQLWADLGCPEFRVCIEYDGAHHLTPAQQSRDNHRNELAAELGWLQLKLNKGDLAQGEQWIGMKAARFLERRGWRG